MEKFTKTIITELVTLLIIYVIGIVFYHTVEGWSYADCFYFVTMTATTVGAYIRYPTTDFSKIFTCFFAFFSIGLALIILTSFQKRWTEKRYEERLINLIVDSGNKTKEMILEEFHNHGRQQIEQDKIKMGLR